jgi:hypothetical protein
MWAFVAPQPTPILSAWCVLHGLCFVFLCFVFCVLCFVFCVLCFVFCVLCFCLFVCLFVLCCIVCVVCVVCADTESTRWRKQCRCGKRKYTMTGLVGDSFFWMCRREILVAECYKQFGFSIRNRMFCLWLQGAVADLSSSVIVFLTLVWHFNAALLKKRPCWAFHPLQTKLLSLKFGDDC